MHHYITRRFIGGFLLAILLPNFATALTNEDLSKDPVVQTKQIKSVIEDVFAGESLEVIETVTRICMCESGARSKANKPLGTIVHIESDGSVREGKTNPDDTGACQINPEMHSKHFWARKQLDPDNIVDNIRYAKALIEDKRNRSRPLWEDWRPSEKCWRLE